MKKFETSWGLLPSSPNYVQPAYLIRFLRCRVKRNGVPSERVVVFKDVRGRKIEGVFPRERIRKNMLEVNVLFIGRKQALISDVETDGRYGFGGTRKGIRVYKNQLSSEGRP